VLKHFSAAQSLTYDCVCVCVINYPVKNQYSNHDQQSVGYVGPEMNDIDFKNQTLTNFYTVILTAGNSKVPCVQNRS